MTLLERMQHWLYGPVIDERATQVVVGPIVVSVTAIEEVLMMMSRSAKEHVSQVSGPGVRLSVLKSTQVGDSTWPDHDLSRLTDADWDQVWFQVTVEAVQGSTYPHAGQYQEGLMISRQAGTVTSARPGLPIRHEDSLARRKDLAEVLARGGQRLMPRPVRARLLAMLLSAGVLGLWLWTMLEVQPPLPAWMLSGVLAVGGSWIFADRIQRLMLPGGVDQAKRGVLVDMTPRREVEANRLNRRLNWRVGLITSLIAGPLGIAAGAILTKIIGT